MQHRSIGAPKVLSVSIFAAGLLLQAGDAYAANVTTLRCASRTAELPFTRVKIVESAHRTSERIGSARVAIIKTEKTKEASATTTASDDGSGEWKFRDGGSLIETTTLVSYPRYALYDNEHIGVLQWRGSDESLICNSGDVLGWGELEGLRRMALRDRKFGRKLASIEDDLRRRRFSALTLAEIDVVEKPDGPRRAKHFITATVSYFKLVSPRGRVTARFVKEVYRLKAEQDYVTEGQGDEEDVRPAAPALVTALAKIK